MRLIDADKLELKHFVQRVTEQPISYEGTQPVYANYDIIAYDVDNAPTVEAIPIEWLLNHLEVGNKEQNDTIYHLIELWREENENN